MKIGFFGGCFNPPTNAHINLAKKVINECKLDKLIFVPVGDFYQKAELAKSYHRYNMLKVACRNLEGIEVSDIELNVKNKLYAIDAFKLIEKEYLGEDIFFIMGADNFNNILNWKDIGEINKYKYIVLEREGIAIDKLEYFKRNAEKIQIIENKKYEKFSSTVFRNMIKNKNICNQDIISKEVFDYIMENELYK